MPPTHLSQADVAAAYRTLIAHETEPKEQDFYRTRLQRLGQATESVCEFDCRSRVAAAGVGVYCPQCSAKCADTDLTTQLAKAIRAAWVDRLDWDELAHAALKFLNVAGRLVPAGGMALTAEDLRYDGWVGADMYMAMRKVGIAEETAEAAMDYMKALGLVVRRKGVRIAPADWPNPAPAEPAEEETEAEAQQLRDLSTALRAALGILDPLEGGGWAHAWQTVDDLDDCANRISSPVVPAPTETGPWATWESVPDDVWFTSASAVGFLPAHRKRGSLVDWQFRDGSVGVYDISQTWNAKLMARAPFVAAEEG